MIYAEDSTVETVEALDVLAFPWITPAPALPSPEAPESDPDEPEAPTPEPDEEDDVEIVPDT